MSSVEARRFRGEVVGVLKVRSTEPIAIVGISTAIGSLAGVIGVSFSELELYSKESEEDDSDGMLSEFSREDFRRLGSGSSGIGFSGWDVEEGVMQVCCCELGGCVIVGANGD